MRLNTGFSMVIVLAFLGVTMWADPKSTVSQIDGPGAFFTDAAGINNRGDIVGSFQDGRGVHGYVFRRGNFTVIDVPVQGAQTVAMGNNERGQVSGAYRSQGLFKGFVWDAGRFTTGIASPGDDESFLHVINNRGQIVGHSRRDVFSLARAFLWEDGKFTFLDLPGVLVVGRNRESMGLNDRGDVVGTFQSQGINHGFLFIGGDIIQIDVPGARSTRAAGINNRGEIVGSFIDASDVERAYLRHTDGTFTEIDAPEAAGIAAVRINDRSDIVGMFNDAAGRFSGFVWNRGSDSTASMPGLFRRIDARAGLE